MNYLRMPQMHIADSVERRIMRAMQKMDQSQPQNVAAQGAQLDQALAAPVGDVAAPAGIEEAIAGKALDL